MFTSRQSPLLDAIIFAIARYEISLRKTFQDVANADIHEGSGVHGIVMYWGRKELWGLFLLERVKCKKK